jgi:hypothetical protein
MAELLSDTIAYYTSLNHGQVTSDAVRVFLCVTYP